LRSKKESAWISACMAAASSTAFSTTFSFKTGSTPGSPVHTGQILLLGVSSQESALQEQKILVWVFNWIWVSRPITASYSNFLSSYKLESTSTKITLIGTAGKCLFNLSISYTSCSP